ncbi:MAG TPA: hypothetical protein VEU33_08580, partial [Archangium sp.]|nr:hypothetical protein [Archangium sp.]
ARSVVASPDITRKPEVPAAPAVVTPPAASAPASAQAPASPAPVSELAGTFPVTLRDAPLPTLDVSPELEKLAVPVKPQEASAAPAQEPAAPPASAQPSPKAESAPAAPSPVQEPKKAEPAAVVPVAAPPSGTSAPAREPLTASPVVPTPTADPAPASPERKPRTVAVQPVELPSEPAGDMQVASHLELMDWRQSETADAGPGAESSSPWARRAIEVDFSSEEASPTEAGVSDAEGEIPLASVHEFIPTWDPSAEPPPAEPATSAPPEEGFAGWEADGTGAPESAPAGNSERIQLVQFQESLEALRQATTRGELGKVLLDYCQGRFPRGFLLGETFGYARVGRAYGPGSDKLEVSALQVDLEAPSLLAMAAAGGRAVVSSVPESPVDEQIFSALGESFSHLMAAPIRLHQRAVGFVVLDSGPSPFGAEELDELEQLLSAASEVYGRLHDAIG